MINPERVKERVFKALKSQKLQVKMYDDEGMSTLEPTMASRWYVDEPNLLIHVDAENEEIIFNKRDIEFVPIEVYKLIINAIKIVVREYMYKFTIKNYGEITPKMFAKDAKKAEVLVMDGVQESVMYGSKKTSRQVIEDVNIVVKHKTEVDENVRGSRSRNIQAIFLEHAGERYRFPHNSLMGARSMARHVTNGGQMHDSIGESIVEMTAKMLKLREFYNYSKRNKLINEESKDVITALQEGMAAIKYDLESLAKKRTYETAALRISERETFIAEEDNGIDYKEMFTVKKFNDVFEEMMPMISNIVQERDTRLKRIEESSLNPVKLTKALPPAGSAGITYESKAVSVGYRLKDVANTICENEELSEYMSTLAAKMISEGEISDFEMQVVGNVLQNAIMETEAESVDMISESLSYFNQSLTAIERKGYAKLAHSGIMGVLIESMPSDLYRGQDGRLGDVEDDEHSYKLFMHDLDQEFQSRIGQSVHDMEDYNWPSCHADGMDPSECFDAWSEDHPEYQMS